MLVVDVVKALLVRIVLLVHSLLVIWLASSMKHEMYWLLTLGNLGMVVEAVVTVWKNKAQEWKW